MREQRKHRCAAPRETEHTCSSRVVAGTLATNTVRLLMELMGGEARADLARSETGRKVTTDCPDFERYKKLFRPQVVAWGGLAFEGRKKWSELILSVASGRREIFAIYLSFTEK